MAQEPVINVKCPCCQAVLEIHVETERVLSHRKGLHLRDDASPGEDGFDVAFRQDQDAKRRLASRFDEAQKNLAGQKDRLDQLFREAQKKVADEKEPPADGNPLRRGKIWD